MPGVVDADENRDNVGVDVNRVFGPTVAQVLGAVAADTEIDKFEFGIGERSLYIFSRVKRIPVSEIVYVRTVASGVGDAVALK